MEGESRLFQSCKSSYELVLSFLNDTQPWGLISKNRPGYEYDAKLRSQVKQKVSESLNVIETSLERHGYVEDMKTLYKMKQFGEV